MLILHHSHIEMVTTNIWNVHWKSQDATSVLFVSRCWSLLMFSYVWCVVLMVYDFLCFLPMGPGERICISMTDGPYKRYEGQMWNIKMGTHNAHTAHYTMPKTPFFPNDNLHTHARRENIVKKVSRAIFGLPRRSQKILKCISAITKQNMIPGFVRIKLKDFYT